MPFFIFYFMNNLFKHNIMVEWVHIKAIATLTENEQSILSRAFLIHSFVFLREMNNIMKGMAICNYALQHENYTACH